MNKRLLFLSASLLMSVAAMAQWVLPVPEKFEALTVEHADGSTGLAANINESEEPSTYYYLYNKESGLFLRQGNSWETQASVGTNPLKVYFVSEIEGDDTEVLIKPWATNRTSYAWRTLFLDPNGTCYVDHASQTNYYWYWDDLGDNTYRFYGSAMNPDYNQLTYPDCYFGFDLHGGSSFTGACAWNLNTADVPEGHKYCVEWKLVSEEEYAKIAEQYAAVLPGAEFQNRVNYAKSLEGIDISRYTPALSNAETTVAEFDSLRAILNSAISLKEAVNSAAKEDPAINLSRFKDFYGSADATIAEMDSVRGLISPAVTLSRYINTLAEEYPEIDATAAKALLAKADWTVAEINSMTNDLKTQARRLDVAVYLDGATEDDPRDGTMLLENPRFDTGNINGWTVAIQGQNIGYQETAGNLIDFNLPDGTAVRGYANTDRNGYYSWLWKFIESWAPSATLPNGTIHQVITGLPSGKYKFSCDAIATYQPDANRQPQGVYLFAKSGQYEFTEPIFSANEKPEHFELTFISVNDTITFGLKADGANTNWLAADNFEITYYGPVTDNPYKIALDATIASLEQKYPNMDDVMANAKVKEAYEAALESAREASETGSEDDDFLAASKLLGAAADSLAVSVNDYGIVAAAITRCENEQERFEGTSFAGLGEVFGDLLMNIEDGYKDGNVEEILSDLELDSKPFSLTIAELPAFMDKLIIDFITENVKAGDEITLLINNPAFDSRFSGWTRVSGNTPAWGGNKNSQGTNKAVNYETGENYVDMDLVGGCAEVYKAKFDIQQVVKNLPKGSYTLTVQAFSRHENGQYVAEYEQGPETGITAVLYCNDFEKKVSNILASAQPWPIFGYGDNYSYDKETGAYNKDGWAGDNYIDGYGFCPNGMEGANYHFNIDKKNYENKINFVLTEDGDSIVIGIKNTANDSWVLFDNFRLYYNGNDDVTVFKETVDGLVADLTNAFVDAEGFDVKAGKDAHAKAEAAIEDLKAKYDEGNVENLIASIANANETLKYVKESIDLYAQLFNTFDEIMANEGALTLVPEEKAAEATNIIDTIETALDACDKTNEEVAAIIADAKAISTYLSEANTLRDQLFEVGFTLEDAIKVNKSTASPNVVAQATALNDEITEKQNAQLDNEEVKELISKANSYINWLSVDVSQAVDRSALLPEDVADATVDNPVDVSAVIENATFDTIGDFHGWTSGFGAGGATSTQAECYNKTYNVYQDITGLPAGYYVAVVQGYYRHGSSANDWTLYNAESKAGQTQAYFYAISGDDIQETEVVYCSEFAMPADSTWRQGVEAGNGLYVPNSMQQAKIWFDRTTDTPASKYYAGKAYYNNLVQIHVDESGFIRIGVKKDATINDNDWSIYDNFQLYYIGAEKDSNPVGIKVIETTEGKAVFAEGIYNLQGQKLAAPQKGLIIVDGKKVLVK